MGAKIFVSYGHGDMMPEHWLNRLQTYLAPLRRDGAFEIWDDSRIDTGANWRAEIDAALREASAAVLLVGPAFLASSFVALKELPDLLNAAKTRGLKIIPLVVGYCAYKRSVLEPYQSHNPPNEPLEALPRAEQNKILNDFALAIDEAVRHAPQAPASPPDTSVDLLSALTEMQTHLRDTRAAFEAQCDIRDQLFLMMTKRLKPKEELEYERFFFRYYEDMEREERFLFQQIRVKTEGPMHDGNRRLLEILEAHPVLIDEIPALASLRQHLVFWLNKYDRLFSSTPGMCLLYVGVEDGVPFPPDVDWVVEQRLKQLD